MGIFRRNVITTESISDPLLRAITNQEEITETEAMMIPAVSGAVNMICDTIAMTPIKLYVEEDGKVREAKDPRVDLLNDNTQDTLDGYQFKHQIVKDYLLTKGGYAYLRKKRNNFVSIHYVDSKKVSIKKNEDPIFKVFNIKVDEKTYKPFEFLKLLRNTKDGASGTGIVGEVEKALQAYYRTILFQLDNVKRGGRKRGFLQAEKKLSDEALKKLKEAWAEIYADNADKMIVLNDGIKFQEAASNSTELQINQTKSSFEKDIDKIFHISNDYETTFKQAIAPVMAAIECALNRDFLLESEKDTMFWAFDVSEALRLSMLDRFQAYKIAQEIGLFTINEIRYKENANAIEGMDVINLGLASVLYDVEKKMYYTPNTGQIVESGKEVEQIENPNT